MEAPFAASDEPFNQDCPNSAGTQFLGKRIFFYMASFFSLKPAWLVVIGVDVLMFCQFITVHS